MKTGKKIIVLLVLVFILMPVFAQAVSWWPLVPCGLNSQPSDVTLVDQNGQPHDYTKKCNQCDLLLLLKNIIDFILIGLMPPAAAILFVWGGFLILMGGANPGLITQGKSIFWNTAIGVAIISSSWLITNTIIRSIGAETVTVDGVVTNVASEWWKFECRVTTAVSPIPTTTTTTVPQPGPLTITTASLSDARQDSSYSQTVQAMGGTAPYSWSITGSLPAGLIINSSTGEISGKPTTSGNYTFTVTAEDSSPAQDLVSKQLSIKVVTQASSVTISNVASSNVTANSATITWTTDKPSTSQVAYGTTTAYGPPTSLNSSQVTNHSVNLSGLNGNTTYNYQVVSSITGFTARSSNYTLKTLLTSNPFSILISLLPDAVAGIPYSETISLEGGQGPYTFTIGTLPPGLTGNPVTGEISGTPTTPGTSTVTVKVEDSSTPKKTVTKPITIKVVPQSSSGACNQNFGLTPASGCSGTNCVVASNITPTHGCESHDGVCLLSSEAAEQARKFVSTFSNLSGGSCTLRLSSTIQGGDGPSVSLCHKPANDKSGSCADFNLLPSHDSCYQKFYQAARDSGAIVSFLDEYVQACRPTNATGGNIHVNFSKPSGPSTSTLSITTAPLPGGTVGQSYSQQLVATGGSTPRTWSISSGTLPAGLTGNPSTGTISGTPTTAGTSTFIVKVMDSSSPQKSATKQLSIVVGTGGTLACMFNGVNYSTFNLCSDQRRPGGCGTSVCSQYLPSIQRYAGGAATVAVLKTFMVIESDCNIKAGTGTSYGLMQISPNTGKPLAYKCGLSPDVVTPSWLTDPANADKSICLGAAIINSIAAGTCGSQPRNIYAGYNAGPGYCTASNDCAGEQSCGGGTKKKWECPYDNPQHTVCNTGMYQTKQGATYINYCLNNLSF